MYKQTNINMEIADLFITNLFCWRSYNNTISNSSDGLTFDLTTDVLLREKVKKEYSHVHIGKGWYMTKLHSNNIENVSL
jgi:hypothetical protein